MAERPIGIYLLARTAILPGLERWLDVEHGVRVDPEETTAAEAVVGLAAKRCYRSFEPGLNPNVTKVRRDWTAYLDHVLAAGHGSVLEHASFTFAIEGLTRVATAELNRHRAGWAVSEQSLRYVRLDALDWWVPHVFRAESNDDPALRKKKELSRELLRNAFEDAAERIRTLVELWDVDALPFADKKRLTSAFRRLVPLGVSTGGVWTGNVRALRHVIALRSAPEAEEEIAHVFTRIGLLMKSLEPRLFGDFALTPDGYLQPKYAKV